MSEGKGAVLFLHAYPLNRLQWREQFEVVRDAGWMVAAPDFPGFGDAPYLGEATLDDFADRALNLLTSIDVSEAVVVGLSMGGYVAFRLLERHPEVVRAVVLADTRAGADSPERRAARLEQAARAEEEGVAWLAEAMLPTLVAGGADSAVAADVRALIGEASAAGVAAALRAMADRPDSTPLLAGIRVPALVLAGSDDAVTPPDEARAMAAAMPGASFELIPAAGHLSNLENPEAFNRALLEFLVRVNAGA